MDGGPQRIYILVKKNRSLRGCKLDEKSYEFFTKEWAFDLNGDMQFTPYHFVRIPIIISGHVMINGRKKTIFIIAIHAKSKMIREGRELWDHRLEEEQRNLFIKQAVKNRRKIAGEWYKFLPLSPSFSLSISLLLFPLFPSSPLLHSI